MTWGALAIAIIFALLDLTKFSVPNSPALLTAVLVYVAFQNGLKPALFFAATIWIYTAFHFSLPGYLFHYDKDSLIRIITFAFMYPINAFMVGLLKNQLVDKIRDERIMKEQIISSAKLSSLGEMAAGIAHEINNPLTIISAKCQILKRMAQANKLSDELVSKNVEDINQTIERMSKIIRGLKSFSRDASQDNMEVASVNGIIDSTLSFCQEKFNNRNVRLIYENEKSSHLFLMCRPTELSQILLNLLNNANDAIENSEDKWIEIAANEHNDQISISITDSGNKIPENVRSKIMQPFFTTKELGRGTGLGLSISLGIARAHGGTLSLDETCKNTRFVIKLPTKGFVQTFDR